MIAERPPVDRKARLQSIPPMPELRPADERVRDFGPALIDLTPDQAKAIAAVCIHCPNPAPCQKACPAGNDISEALWLIEEGDFLGAAAVYRRTSTLPEICGRVCPHEDLCQGACVRNKRGLPVYTGQLEAFVSDYARAHNGKGMPVGEDSGKLAAVVGAGPSGLACAARLRQAGHQVTVFDKNPEPGGLLRYGIPDFKLPVDVVKARIQDLADAGVQFELGTEVGGGLSVDDLMAQGFEAVYLAVGTWKDNTLKAPGVDLPGVIQASDFLYKAKVDIDSLASGQDGRQELGRRLVVVGGGDTASDCMRTALRLGVEEVTCVYRRTEQEMPGSPHDRQLAQEEGALFKYLIQPVRFLAGPDGRVAQVECLECELGEPDSSGRPRPIPIEGSQFTLPADTVILALGYWADDRLPSATPGLETHQGGLIVVDPETGATSRQGVFAGGDAVSGPDLVGTAMVAGHRAAAAIDRYLREG
jgi:glutamate synthase (NADPH/NADH) small chain